MREMAWLVPSIWLSCFLTGCGGCDVESGDPEAFRDGFTNESQTYYETGSPNEKMLPFPPGKTYDLYHGLGKDPAVHSYVSFVEQLEEDPSKVDPLAPNHVAESAGNQAVIERWNDKFVRVRNDTCANFYLRVILTAP